MKNIMLDLETMGTNNDALVTTINAVQFDLETGETFKEFEIGIEWEEQIRHGAKIDALTVQWWLSQSKEAQNTMMRLDKVSVVTALIAFNNWIDDNFSNKNNTALWGNGASFDNVILRNLYIRHNIEFVLPYWCDMDVRTLVKLKKINTRDFKFQGIKHRGIDDCKHQINYCCSK